MKKLLFVFNPNSGKAQLKNKLMQIVQIFSEGGYDVTVYPTKAAMDGYNYIIENGLSHDVIVCSGGDGTLNETVGAVLHLDERIPIGYIPSGTTNDFARSLGIPKDMIEAAKVIVKGRTFNCDIGMVDGQRSFNYVAAFGAFTEVSYNTPQQLKNVLGHQAYIIEAAKQFMTLKPCYVRVKSDIKNVEGNFVYGMVSNTKSVGGMKFLVGGSTDLQDGLFDCKAVEAGERQHTCSEEARAGVKLRVAMQERDAISGKGSQKIAQHDHEEADCKVTDEQRLAPHG